LIKVVLDTNILVSALITTGKPRALLFKIVDGEAQLILSRGILEELVVVAADDKIRLYVEDEEVAEFLQILNDVAEVVRLRSRFKVVKDDPGDDVILRNAYYGEADYIVSGDKHLLSLKAFRDIKILTVDEILSML